ncbi:MAG: LysM peptidoglycan-binding domain-containing protein, partial [Acetobacteraceae bacterium]|nr:LysM peptidoglycan-binding domain-containing protein [Acetobacteraceae bacterium]
GQWTLTPLRSVPNGVHQFRVDQLEESGRVTTRVELPFQRTASPSADAALARVVVQPGQNLWRIARFTYGAGIRYTVIYLANRDQIRDPRRIYPGQVFSTPAP